MTELYSYSLDLSIVVVTYNSRDYVPGCLDSVSRAAGNFDHEIIVVDNASQDGTPELVRQQFPNVRLFANRHNRGYAQGNNQGMAQSRGRYILLLNPDTVVRPGALLAMLQEMKRSPGTGLLGCRLLNADGSLQQSFGFEVSFVNEAVRKFFFNLWEDHWFPPAGWILKSLHARKREVAWVKGTCMLLCRQAVFDAELMDENFFMYLEDADLSRRIRQLGWKVRYTPEAEVTHFGGGSTRSNPGKSAVEHRRSQLHYFKKHLGHTHLKALKFYLRLKMRKNILWLNVRQWIGWGSREQLAEQKLYLQEILSLTRNFH